VSVTPSLASPSVLTAAALGRDLAIRDLTDPSTGPHAVQLLVDDAVGALAAEWRCSVRVHRSRPIVPIEDNYDRLGYSPDAVTRDVRYTRYVSETCVLRTHTSALIPPALRQLAAAPDRDVLLACPGIVYRRDAIDRLHSGTPHQLDLWRVVDRPMGDADLQRMIAVVVGCLLPGIEYRAEPRVHPYTDAGRQVDVLAGGQWVEILECGLAAPAVLAGAGIDAARHGGLAMGIGLDRVLMVRKGIPDIRLLRSTDTRVSQQLLDLDPYREVSSQPPIQRDMSVAVAADTTPEELGDRVREALGREAESVEAIEVVSETPAAELLPVAAERLGIGAGQKNVLLRVVLRNFDRTLTRVEANVLRDRIFTTIHQGH
jgi:phenylalanyl-tRNA synthetase alpha chain